MKGVESLTIRPVEDGCLIAVKAVPGASRDRIAAVLGPRLKIATSRPPEKGRANAAIAAVLADALGVGRRDVRLATGPTSPRKEFAVRGLSPDQARRRLAEL
jgi:hypothetical protein